MLLSREEPWGPILQAGMVAFRPENWDDVPRVRLVPTRREILPALCLVALNLGVFLLVRSPELSPLEADTLLPSGEKIDRGEVWRPLSSLVAHENVGHLVLNCTLTLAAVPPAVRKLGPRRFVVAYVGGGFATNALRYAAGGARGGGASAGIFAGGAAAAASALADSPRSRRSTVMGVLGLFAAGGYIAGTLSDNHVLALAVGGVLGLADASDQESRPPSRFVKTAWTLTLLAAALMGARAARA